MQIPTNAFYDRAAQSMRGLTQQADALQTQISTGKKLSAPSQDPAAYQRLATLKRDGADATAFGTNLSLAGSLLSSADTALTSVNDQLQRATELTLQAKTGTQNDASRQAIADELDQIVSSLAALGNTKDSRGQPLFGGADGGAAVTQAADGSYSFAQTPLTAVPIGDGQTVQATETAGRVFKAGGTDILTAISSFSSALKAGGDIGAAATTALTTLQTSSDQVTTIQASLGARAARVDLATSQQTSAATDRESIRSGLEDTDVTTAITQLQKTMTILSATQASFTKLANLTLFNYLK
jgi:flagellar hook-associated protein 3 FlgL